MADRPQLVVDVIARLDKLEAGLRQAEQKTKASAQKIDKNLGGGISKAELSTAKVFAGVSAAAGAVQVLGIGLKTVQGTIALISGDTETFKERITEAGRIVERLPFGLGEAAVKLRELADVFTDTQETLKEIEQTERRRREADARFQRRKQADTELKFATEELRIREQIAKTTNEAEKARLTLARDTLQIEKRILEFKKRGATASAVEAFRQAALAEARARAAGGQGDKGRENTFDQFVQTAIGSFRSPGEKTIDVLKQILAEVRQQRQNEEKNGTAVLTAS